MVIKKVKKLWQGRKVSIRDYERDKAIVKGGMRLEHNGQVMVLKPEELKELKADGRVHQSRFSGSYQLIDITWTPLTHDPNQGSFL
jgi:hypothetical protein